MFTGIIESTGRVEQVDAAGTNKTFWIASPLSNELKIDQSVSHDGVCLTVEELRDGQHRVTAIEETLKKTNLDHWQPGKMINLERSLQVNGRLDGHFVQGHVDTIAECIDKKTMKGSWEFTFRFAAEYAHLVIEKGSISLCGISLTIFNVTTSTFTVAVIPYTYHHTSIGSLDKGQQVNLEFDLLGKYIARKWQLDNLK